MSSLILIRGLPGSGKSTIAQALIQRPMWLHYEADMLFFEDGEYKFDQSKLKDAHTWCQHATESALLNGYNVVVSNTFTQLWEMQPYFTMAEKQKSAIQVIECKANFGTIHGVPEETIKRMRERWEVYE